MTANSCSSFDACAFIHDLALRLLVLRPHVCKSIITSKKGMMKAS